VAASNSDTPARLLDRGAIHFHEWWPSLAIEKSGLMGFNYASHPRNEAGDLPGGHAIFFTINHRKAINSTVSAVQYLFCATHLYRGATAE
jgi:hypothetical protein